MICECVQIFSGFILQIVLYLALFRIIWVTLRQFYYAARGKRKSRRRLGQTELLADDDDLPRVFLDDSGDHEDLVVNEDALNDDDDESDDADGGWGDDDEEFEDAPPLDQTFDGNDSKGGGGRLNQTFDANDSQGGGGRLNQTFDANDSKGGGGRLNQTFDANDSKGGGGRLNQTFDANDSKGGGGRLNQTFDANDSKGGGGRLNQTFDANDSQGGGGRLNQTFDANDSQGGGGRLNQTLDANDSKGGGGRLNQTFDADDPKGDEERLNQTIDDADEEGWVDIDADDKKEEEEEINPFLPKKTWTVYQNYEDILRECLEKKVLFEDPEFPANFDSIAFTPQRKELWGNALFTWTRPPQITDEPKFFMDGSPTRFNMILPGFIEDFGLATAIANMSLYPELIYKVAPRAQHFTQPYAGVFLFKFWHFGEWIEVVVDDRLPCNDGQLVFAKSRDEKEFWFALLEKAFAKLHGAYEALETVGVSEALVDLTGGIAELYSVNHYRDDDIFNILTRSNEMQSLISSTLYSDELMNTATEDGLYPGKAYSVTNVAKMLVNRPAKANEPAWTYVELMIRLRSPFGEGTEWKGPWRDKGEEWAWVSDEEKARLDIKHLDDGESWMAYHDFINIFEVIEIVSLTPSSIEHSHKIPWESTLLHGEWVAGVSAGGMKYIHKNPQYKISLTAVDEQQGDGKCVASISIMQKYRGSMRKLGKHPVAIGFQLYHLKEDYLRIFPVPEQFFLESNYALVHCRPTVARDVTLTARVPPGTYLVIPFTDEHSIEAEFLVRVCATSFVKLSKHDRLLRIRAKQDIIDTDVLFEQHAEKFDEYGVEEISWKNLKVIMDYFGSSISHFKGFSKETVRSAIAMSDRNMNGRIDRSEYDSLCTMLHGIKSQFVHFDKKNTGYLPPFALTLVLENLGLQCNNTILGSIVHRFGREDGSITFDDYILCVIKISTLITKFHTKRAENSKVAQFGLDDWLQANIFI